MEWNAEGLRFAIAAGAFVGLAEIISFHLFSHGMKASVGIPIIIGLTIFTSVTLGILFSEESLNLMHVFGIVLIAGGVIILGLEG